MDGERTPGDRYLLLSGEERKGAWNRVAAAIDRYVEGLEALPIKPKASPRPLRTALAAFDFSAPRPVDEVIDFVVEAMASGQLHTSHPAYFGVFNPRPATLGVLGDTLAAALNPQLASWTSGPFAIEAEQHVLRHFARLFGYPEARSEGIFTHGGTEANHTALLTALVRHFPDFAKGGARALPGAPTLYVATEAHHSFLKAARLCGLGTDAVREVAVDSDLRLDPVALRTAVTRDREAGKLPFFAVASAGTTGAGTVDRIAAVSEVAVSEGLWLHLDAAWGGPAILLPELGHLFEGVENVDSLTLDAHKWLSVPMTAGMYLTRHAGVLEATFRVDHTHYMPLESAKSTLHQPYAQSMSWSRRFLGLKVFMALAAAGWDGYRETLRHQVRMGERLREKLAAAGWRVVNRTALPVACFVDTRHPEGATLPYLERIARKAGETGRTWLTTVELSHVGPALRAGIANFSTREPHLDELVATLEIIRGDV